MSDSTFWIIVAGFLGCSLNGFVWGYLYASETQSGGHK